MRPFVLALPLAAALAMATAPTTLADQPTSLDIFIPSGTKVCLGDRKLLATITERLERSVTGLQFSSGATVKITELMSPPSEVAHISFVPVGPKTITLVDDWTSLPNGALSDGLRVKVWATGKKVGRVAPDLGNVTFRTREISPKPQAEDTDGSLYQFEVVRCAPRATLPPTDASASPGGRSEQATVSLALVNAWLGFVLGLAAWKRRSTRRYR